MKLSTHFSRATLVALLAASAGAGALLALTGHRDVAPAATETVASDAPPAAALHSLPRP